jgi:hypothetical protein
MQRLLILEANEISRKVFERFAEYRPRSTIAAMFRHGRFVETNATDVPEAELYPSQTWASMNTGTPYSHHRIHWYNDEKRYSDFYWHRVAQKRSVVLVNSLHTSPLSAYGHAGKFDLVIPDCFAADDAAKPDFYRPFQRLNCNLAQRNGRRSFIGETLGSAAKAFASAPYPGRWGLGARSAKDIASILVAATSGERERLRGAQFPLLADIFVRAVKRSRPGLGVLFTNHVAAMQHRYWYALFPEDYAEILYSAEWVERHAGAILAAMDLLDRWLKLIARVAVAMDYTLLITTSMGQGANRNLKPGGTSSRREYIVRDPLAVLRALDPTPDGDPVLEGAMAPQYTFRYRSREAAQAAKERINALRLSGMLAHAQTNGCKLTLSMGALAAEIQVNNRRTPATDVGFTQIDADDHHSGRHDPAGSMFVFNDRNGVFDRLHGEIDYLAVAPLIKDAWG